MERLAGRLANIASEFRARCTKVPIFYVGKDVACLFVDALDIVKMQLCTCGESNDCQAAVIDGQ